MAWLKMRLAAGSSALGIRSRHHKRDVPLPRSLVPAHINRRQHTTASSEAQHRGAIAPSTAASTRGHNALRPPSRVLAVATCDLSRPSAHRHLGQCTLSRSSAASVHRTCKGTTANELYCLGAFLGELDERLGHLVVEIMARLTRSIDSRNQRCSRCSASARLRSVM